MTQDSRRWVAGGVFYGALAIIALLVTFAVVQTFGLVSQVRETQQGNASVLKSAQAAAESAEKGTDRIEDCTTPGRKCYDDGQKQTAQYLSDLNRVIAYAAACADQAGVQTEAEVYACVIQRLADDDSRDGG